MKFRSSLRVALLVGIVGALFAPSAQAYQQNYTCEGGPEHCAPGQAYAPIHWGTHCLDFYLDQEGSADFRAPGQSGVSRALEKIVTRSFNSWSKPACSGLSLSYQGTLDARDQAASQGRNIVSFEPAQASGTSAMVFATTYVSYNPNTGVISDADIHMNTAFYEFTDTPQNHPNKADLQNTLTHEVGHLLGFGHSPVVESTMFGGAQIGETHKRSLHDDDIALLCASYPSDAATPSCVASDTEDQPLSPDIWQDSKADSPGESYAALGADTQEAGCSVTGRAASATLGPWFFAFGLLFVGWIPIRSRKRPR